MGRRVSRAEIEGVIDGMGIEAALGVQRRGPSRLTSKQRKFAEAIAQGESKAGAYRAAYDSNAKPHHQSLEGQRLMATPAIAQQVEALRLAAEARRYATPAALRSLVIERLTAHAIDDDIQPAQRLRALELLGKVTEVAAFTERREVITQRDPVAARAALLDNLRAALRDGSITVEPVRDALPVAAQPVRDALAGDASEGAGMRSGQDGGPPPAPPGKVPASGLAPMLSNPHIQAPDPDNVSDH
jgi:hypothetical protein